MNFLLCILAASIGESILKNNKFIPVITCLVLSVIKIMMVAVLFIPFNKKVNIDMALISALMNTILMFLGYKFILNKSKKYWKKDEWRFR